MEEAPANSVPAAAVTRGAQALFGIIGRKGRAGGLVSQVVKARGSTLEVHLKQQDLNTGEERGIPGVEVKFVDIREETPMAKASLWTDIDAEARRRG